MRLTSFLQGLLLGAILGAMWHVGCHVVKPKPAVVRYV